MEGRDASKFRQVYARGSRCAKSLAEGVELPQTDQILVWGFRVTLDRAPALDPERSAIRCLSDGALHLSGRGRI